MINNEFIEEIRDKEIKRIMKMMIMKMIKMKMKMMINGLIK